MTERRGGRGDLIPPPDVVYPYRASNDDDELRYSLRSLANITHGTVWIVGDLPRWIQGAKHIPRPNSNGSRFRNAMLNVKAAADCAEVADRFVLMNDDFFVLQPIDDIPVFHRGPIAQAHPRPGRVKRGGASRGSPWLRGIWDTESLLHEWGVESPLSYELHVPMLCEREKMAEVLDRALSRSKSVNIQQRTLYGNVYQLGGERVKVDPKVGGSGTRTWSEGDLFVSTTNRSFYRGKVGQQLRALFPEPSPYET